MTTLLHHAASLPRTHDQYSSMQHPRLLRVSSPHYSAVERFFSAECARVFAYGGHTMHQTTLHKPPLRTVTLKPRERWDASELIDKFGIPIAMRLPTNVVDGVQRCGSLVIMTPTFMLPYKGVLTKSDGAQLRKLLDLAGGQTKPDFTVAYASLYRIQPYLR